jgi:hypothetical protein
MTSFEKVMDVDQLEMLFDSSFSEFEILDFNKAAIVSGSAAMLCIKNEAHEKTMRRTLRFGIHEELFDARDWTISSRGNPSGRSRSC